MKQQTALAKRWAMSTQFYGKGADVKAQVSITPDWKSGGLMGGLSQDGPSSMAPGALRPGPLSFHVSAAFPY